MANNPGGTNQIGPASTNPAYGDIKRQTELTREAPISGAALSGRALNTPRRGAQQAKRGGTRPAPIAAPPQAATPPAQPNPSAYFHAISQIPGASPLVQSMFGGSQTQ